MCLNRLASKKEIRKHFKPKKEGWRNFGWKVFKINNIGELYPVWQGTSQFPRGKWLNEKDYRKNKGNSFIGYGPNGKRYPTGFHLYWGENHGDNGGQRIKVYYRKIVAKGYQSGRVIVAQEIFIPYGKKKK